MNIFKLITELLFIISFLFICTTSGISQDIVRVDAERAEIHVKPELTGSHFMVAQKGDLFELESLSKGWAGIKMFSGKIRYLKSNEVEVMSDFYSEQVDFSKRIELCQDVNNIEDQATEEAISMYPEDQKSADEYKNVLIDNGILSLFRKNKIPATHNLIFLDCLNDSLVPFLD